ncbi:MAG: hypothetical protein COA42_12760 [Alteromonadaceae bacterium]|nr:MAG: hypothetical protein COA42_12760 [Alteromonadaceae bacterium]
MSRFNLKFSLVVAVVLSLSFLTGWELYWRTQTDFYRVGLDDDRNLWAEHRAKLENAGKDDVVILGSSRSGFNFRTSVWEEVQGRAPINLSANGKSVGPILVDIITNTDFSGTLVVGVTPLMFFFSGGGPSWDGAADWVEYYYKQTYAQKLNYALLKPLERNLILLSASEMSNYNDLDLKSIINNIPLTGRISEGKKLVSFGYNDEDRNIYMYPRMKPNTEYSKAVTDVWAEFMHYLPDYSAVEGYMPGLLEGGKQLIDIFKARGGKVIFVRHKTEQQWTDTISRLFPRDKVWDEFVRLVDCPAYHYEDHSFMSQHVLPEWSHMSAESALVYTRDMVERMIADGHLKSYDSQPEKSSNHQ